MRTKGLAYKHTHEPHDWVVGAAGEQQTCWQLEPLAEHVSYWPAVYVYPVPHALMGPPFFTDCAEPIYIDSVFGASTHLGSIFRASVVLFFECFENPNKYRSGCSGTSMRIGCAWKMPKYRKTTRPAAAGGHTQTDDNLSPSEHRE
jgi:hypothetical protein